MASGAPRSAHEVPGILVSTPRGGAPTGAFQSTPQGAPADADAPPHAWAMADDEHTALPSQMSHTQHPSVAASAAGFGGGADNPPRSGWSHSQPASQPPRSRVSQHHHMPQSATAAVDDDAMSIATSMGILHSRVSSAAPHLSKPPPRSNATGADPALLVRGTSRVHSTHGSRVSMTQPASPPGTMVQTKSQPQHVDFDSDVAVMHSVHKPHHAHDPVPEGVSVPLSVAKSVPSLPSKSGAPVSGWSAGGYPEKPSAAPTQATNTPQVNWGFSKPSSPPASTLTSAGLGRRAGVSSWGGAVVGQTVMSGGPPPPTPTAFTQPPPRPLVRPESSAWSQYDNASGLTVDAEDTQHVGAARVSPRRPSPPRMLPPSSQHPPALQTHSLPEAAARHISPQRGPKPIDTRIVDVEHREAAVARREQACADRERDVAQREVAAVRALQEQRAPSPEAVMLQQHLRERELAVAERERLLGERERAAAAAAAGVAEIQAREVRVSEREAGVHSREVELARRVREYEVQAAELAQAMDTFERERAKTDARDTHLEERERMLLQAERRAEATEAAAVQRNNFAEHRQATVLALEREAQLDIAERERAVAENETRLMELRQRLQEIERDMSRREADVAAQEDNVGERLRILEPKETRVGELEVALVRREEQLEASETAARHRQQKTDLHLQDLEGRLRRREAQSDEIDASLEMKLQVLRDGQGELARRETAVLRREEAVARLERSSINIDAAAAAAAAAAAIPQIASPRATPWVQRPTVSPIRLRAGAAAVRVGSPLADPESIVAAVPRVDAVASDLSAIRARLAAIKRDGALRGVAS